MLKNGQTLRGVARNRSNYSLQVQDAKGALHLLLMSDVASVTLRSRPVAVKGRR